MLQKQSRVYDLDDPKLNNLLRDVLHFIKYDEKEEIFYWLDDCKYGLNNIDGLTDSEFLKLCKIATFTDVANEKRGKELTGWSTDPRLYYKKGYRSEDVHPIDIFNAYQSEFNHNIFYMNVAFDVL